MSMYDDELKIFEDFNYLEEEGEEEKDKKEDDKEEDDDKKKEEDQENEDKNKPKKTLKDRAVGAVQKGKEVYNRVKNSKYDELGYKRNIIKRAYHVATNNEDNEDYYLDECEYDPFSQYFLEEEDDYGYDQEEETNNDGEEQKENKKEEEKKKDKKPEKKIVPKEKVNPIEEKIKSVEKLAKAANTDAERASVVSQCKKIRSAVQSNPDFVSQLNILEKKMKGH